MPGTARRAFTLIEVIVVLTITALLIGIMLPAVLSAMRVARQSACANNLRQIALAMHSYHTHYSCLPAGTPIGTWGSDPPFVGHSLFAAILPQLEQQSTYNGINFDRNIYMHANVTTHATGLAVLWCPSDSISGVTTVLDHAYLDVPSQKFAVTYSSYAACAGTWYHLVDDLPKTRLLATGDNGVAFANSSIRFSDITDGLSHTLLLGERNHGLLEGAAGINAHWWFDGYFGDTLFWTLHPINPQRFVDGGDSLHDETNPLVNSASSSHPGGANFAFADGSVRFVKETIDSWTISYETGLPIGVSGGPSSVYRLLPGVRPGVYQALSTRANGELFEDR